MDHEQRKAEATILNLKCGDEIDGWEMNVYKAHKGYACGINIINYDGYDDIECIYSFMDKEELKKLSKAIEFLIEHWDGGILQNKD